MQRDSEHLDWKDVIWKRLSSDPVLLGLDARTDEEPEDLFVDEAHAGRHNQIVDALNLLFMERVLVGREKLQPSTLRFFRRAMRLCDAIHAIECKQILKFLLLVEPSNRWDGFLPEMQELAARVLSGYAAKKNEVPFWLEIASRQRSSLPYALNVLLDVDLEEGLQAFTRAYIEARAAKRDLAEWAFILETVASTYEPEEFGAILNSVIGDVVDADRPDERDSLFQKFGGWAKLPKPVLRRKKELSETYETVSELVAYDKPMATSSSQLPVRENDDLADVVSDLVIEKPQNSNLLLAPFLRLHSTKAV